MHVRRLTPLLALWVALPVASAQNFEHDLRPAALEGWREAGQAVDIDGDWAIVEGLRPHPNLGLPAVEDLADQLWPGHGHAAVTVPDARKGERLVLVTDYPEAAREALAALGRELGIAEIGIPRTLIKVARLPVLGSGKIDYVTVQSLAEEQA